MKNYYNISTAYEPALLFDNLTQQRQVEVSHVGPVDLDGRTSEHNLGEHDVRRGQWPHLTQLRTNDNEGNDEYWRNAASRFLPRQHVRHLTF